MQCKVLEGYALQIIDALKKRRAPGVVSQKQPSKRPSGGLFIYAVTQEVSQEGGKPVVASCAPSSSLFCAALLFLFEFQVISDQTVQLFIAAQTAAFSTCSETTLIGFLCALVFLWLCLCMKNTISSLGCWVIRLVIVATGN